MFASLWPRRSAVTFDLGASGIRACQLRGTAGRLRLCDALHVSRPGTDSPEPAPTEAATRQIKRLIGQGRFIGRDIGLVLSAPDVQFLPLKLPAQALAQSPERLHQALRWEAARESRIAAEEIEVRHWELPAGRALQANVMAVVLPAARAHAWCDWFAREGLDLRRIDVAPCALTRLAIQCAPPGNDDLWGILDLGMRHATLTVVVGRVPTYVRALAARPGHWTRLIADAFEVTPSVAEQLKHQHGLAAAAVAGERGLGTGVAGRSPLDAPDLPAALTSVLSVPLRDLGTEVGRCFAYVMQSFPEHAVKHLLLAGGGAALRGLAGVLEQELGLPVHVLHDALATADGAAPRVRGLHFDCATAAAMGAALLELEAA